MKTVTIRMPEELAEQLSKEGDSINRVIVDSLTRLQRIRLVSEKELAGVFSAKEWMFLADSLNGTLIDDTFSCNVRALIAHCEDAEELEGTATRYGVDIKELVEKISSLKGANVEALYERVRKGWENGEITTNWARF